MKQKFILQICAEKPELVFIRFFFLNGKSKYVKVVKLSKPLEFHFTILYIKLPICNYVFDSLIRRIVLTNSLFLEDCL